ncbi:hypothetical protein [Ferruginibacter profundus]
MIIIIIVALVLLLLCWCLFATLELYADTRTALISVRWISIGKVMLQYEDNAWWFRLQILCFKKQWLLQQLFSRSSKKKKPAAVKTKKAKAIPWPRLLKIIQTFRVIQCRIVIDTGNYPLNAQLYPLNFLPPVSKYVTVNFKDENYAVIITRNTLWRILYAWIK